MQDYPGAWLIGLAMEDSVLYVCPWLNGQSGGLRSRRLEVQVLSGTPYLFVSRIPVFTGTSLVNSISLRE